jgi:hypothetical protein
MGDTGTAEERQENWSGKLRRDIERVRERYRESLRRASGIPAGDLGVNIMENPRKI